MQPEESLSLVAVARDPECVFVYWGARLPEGARLRLLDEGGGVAGEMKLAQGAGNAYLPVEPDSEYRVHLLVEGRVVGEASVRTPPAGASARLDPRWKGPPREENTFRGVLPRLDPRLTISSPARH